MIIPHLNTNHEILITKLVARSPGPQAVPVLPAALRAFFHARIFTFAFSCPRFPFPRISYPSIIAGIAGAELNFS
jgi:hypothetical protein